MTAFDCFVAVFRERARSIMVQNDSETSGFSDLLQRASQGDQLALGRLLDWSRTFLREGVRQTLSPQLRVRVDESDLIQKVCIAAFEQLGQFRGKSEGEYVQWLRRIFQRDLLDVVSRERNAAKRSVDREVPDGPALIHKAATLLSPSRHAIRNEEREIILNAIAELPEEQQAVVRLRHLEHKSLRDTAIILGNSEDAVVGLLKRGIFKLNELLKRRGVSESEDGQ